MRQIHCCLFGFAFAVVAFGGPALSDEVGERSQPRTLEGSELSPDPPTIDVAEPLLQDEILFQFAVYLLTETDADLTAKVRAIVQVRFPTFQVVDEPTFPIEQKYVLPTVITNVKRDYAVPDLESLRYFGRGISREQAEQLQDCTTAVSLSFALPKDARWDGLKEAHQLISQIARECGGLVWDEETREVFSPDAWDEQRIESWKTEIPDISAHITIHAYRNDEHVRAITLGMVKFGLPDVVVEDVSWSRNNSVGHLINLFCQAMAEETVERMERHVDLNLESLKNPQIRTRTLDSLLENASKVALLSLEKGTRDEGDPDNRLIELKCDRYAGPDAHAQQNALLSSLFGSKDSIVDASHDEELMAASRRAQAKLPQLYADFDKGLTPGEFILVKAPFETPDGGNEWMWVEITAWRDEKIKGLLKNDPFDIPDLHAGQIVEVDQADIFDYIRVAPDGSQEGNETGKIIERQLRQRSDAGSAE